MSTSAALDPDFGWPRMGAQGTVDRRAPELGVRDAFSSGQPTVPTSASPRHGRPADRTWQFPPITRPSRPSKAVHPAVTDNAGLVPVHAVVGQERLKQALLLNASTRRSGGVLQGRAAPASRPPSAASRSCSGDRRRRRCRSRASDGAVPGVSRRDESCRLRGAGPHRRPALNATGDRVAGSVDIALALRRASGARQAARRREPRNPMSTKSTSSTTTDRHPARCGPGVKLRRARRRLDLAPGTVFDVGRERGGG